MSTVYAAMVSFLNIQSLLFVNTWELLSGGGGGDKTKTNNKIFNTVFLPPASEGWGKVIFSVCSYLEGGGVPRMAGVGVPPSQV